MRRTSDGITEVIRHHWDRRAGTFDDQAGHGLVSDEQREAWLELLSRVAGAEPLRVLDVGCGTGFVALRFAELGHTVTGIDLSPQMIERAREKADAEGRPIDFRVGDATKLPLADASYDVVVARHVIWNLPEPRRGLEEWLRVLRPGGRLVLVEGKWADNEAAARAQARPVSRAFRRVVAAAARFGSRFGTEPRRLLSRQYRWVEVQLPFAGGPSAASLAEFLRANSVEDVVTEPLMDPALWGETPEFPRYLTTGTRAARSRWYA
jgi:ubiquinone/menaquinone biosynthesis C-methylase UbiE